MATRNGLGGSTTCTLARLLADGTTAWEMSLGSCATLSVPAIGSNGVAYLRIDGSLFGIKLFDGCGTGTGLNK